MLNFQDDPTAFRAFIAGHQDMVFNVVLNRVQNLQDAEEITQDVFIAVFRKPEAYRAEAAISTWLYRIAINKCIDHLRKKQRPGRWRLTGFFRSTVDGDETNEPHHFLHPGVLSENREKAAMLFLAMKRLPEKQHTAWLLSEMENLSYKEISEVMNVSVSSVESLLFRARQNLKKTLSHMYRGDQ
jgi:RNA polymerase sigma-70 factor (ECF subfamily)